VIVNRVRDSWGRLQWPRRRSRRAGRGV